MRYCQVPPTHGPPVLTAVAWQGDHGRVLDASTKAFRSVEVDEFLARTPKDIAMQKGSYFYHHQTKFVTIAVDPSGGGNSAFAIAAFHYT